MCCCSWPQWSGKEPWVITCEWNEKIEFRTKWFFIQSKRARATSQSKTCKNKEEVTNSNYYEILSCMYTNCDVQWPQMKSSPLKLYWGRLSFTSSYSRKAPKTTRGPLLRKQIAHMSNALGLILVINLNLN